MIAVWKREFRSLFNNVIGWLFLGINLFVYGLYFFAYNLSQGSPSIVNTVYGITFLMLFTAPVLTMRSLSEEKKNHTDQLLWTSPSSVGQIILGKYLALASTFTIQTLVIGISPLFLRIFGKAALKESYTAILGYWLYGLSCIAIGLLISALTESQMIAAILSIAVLFLGYMMSGITGFFSKFPILVKILSCYDLSSPFDNFRSGIIEISSLVYYLSIIVLCLFLTCQVIQKARWTMSIKRLTTGAFSLVSIFALLLVLIAGNIGITKLPSRYRSIDMTRSKFFSLTSDTKKFLNGLQTDITIYCLNTRTEEEKMTSLEQNDTSLPYSGEAVNHTLNLYEGDPHIKVKYIDTDQSPKFASKYSDESLDQGSLILVNASTGKSKVINSSDLFSYGVDNSTYSYQITAFDAEGQITSAIQSITKSNSDKVYIVEGHNETELGSAFSELISKKNMTKDSLNLRNNEIPSDCTLLILNGPTSDLSEGECRKLSTYLSNGGKALLTLSLSAISEGNSDPTPNYVNLLNQYGINIRYGLVEDSSAYTAPNYSWLLYPNVSKTDLTKGITSNPSILVPQAVAMTSGTNENYTTNDFLTTSAGASLVDPQTGKEMTDSKKPEGTGFTLGSEITVGGKEANLIVLASSYMLVDDVESMAPGQNTRLFSNILSAFGGDASKGSVSVASKSYSYQNLQFSARAVVLYGLLWGLMIPIALILIGIIIWAVRRRK
ncbi:MAG: Gldg family protein [Lachnospiraceae bacterium]|nr:Gldg family protein [Lachnospiraceae bacterium]